VIYLFIKKCFGNRRW